MEFLFTPRAARHLKRLPQDIQRRILDKLSFYSKQTDPLDFAEPLTRSELGQYRFRIGDYRVIVDLEGNHLAVLLLGHRRDIYR